MTEIEALFRDRVDSVIGKYFPNNMTLDNFSSYLYREFISLFSDIGPENIVSEISMAGRNGVIDLDSFLKALKDFSFFVAENFMVSCLRSSVSELKGSIPMTERKETHIDNKSSLGTHRSNSVGNSVDFDIDKNVASFDIDITSIPKVDSILGKNKKEISPVVDRISRITEPDRNTFSGVDLSLEEGSRVVGDAVDNIVGSNNKRDEDFEGDLTKDASYLTSGGYKSVPAVSIDLDY